MIMGGVGIRDSKKYIALSGLTLHLDNTSGSYAITGTGSDWLDISGNNKSFRAFRDFAGTVTPRFTKDQFGYYGFEFNGYSSTTYNNTGYYFYELTTPAIDFGMSWTIEVLCRPTGAGRVESGCGSKQATLWSKMGDGTGVTQSIFAGFRQQWWSIDNFNGNQATPDLGEDRVSSLGYSISGAAIGSGQLTTAGFSMIKNNPVYLSFVYDLSASPTITGSYYVNGRFYSSTTTNFVEAPKGSFRVGGKDNNCDQNCWRGWIYNFRMYNRLLTAAEIKQNFEAIRGKIGL